MATMPVGKMASDEKDGEEEYEEVIVLAELNGVLESGDTYFQNAPPYVSLVGLESDAPVLQIGRATFRGSVEDACGTYMVFEPTAGENGKPSYKYLCKTNKKLEMRRVFLQPKESHRQAMVARAAAADLLQGPSKQPGAATVPIEQSDRTQQSGTSETVRSENSGN